MSEYVPPRFPGVTLERNSLGALDVNRDGKWLGWMHHQRDDVWRAYLPSSGVVGHLIGTFTREGAIEAILESWSGHPNG
jgi:hypothetical protein